MKYTYLFNEKPMVVYVSDNESDEEVAIIFNRKSYDGIVKKNEKGKFFTFRKEKIYLNDLKPFDVFALKEKVHKNQYVSPLEFITALRPIFPCEISYEIIKKNEKCNENTFIISTKENAENYDDCVVSCISATENPKTKRIEPNTSVVNTNSYGLTSLLNLGLINIRV